MRNLLMLMVLFSVVACGPSKKLKTDEIKEEKQIEVVEVRESIENEAVAEKTTEDKKEVETDSGVVIRADEVAIDSDGNIAAKGNVEVIGRKTEKKSEVKKQIEKQVKRTTAEVSQKTEEQLEKIEKKSVKEKQVESSGWSLWWWLIVLLVVFVVYLKVKSKFSYFRF